MPLLAEDIILVVLGPKWQDAAAIFRLLAPTILVFGIINPLAWLLQSVGLQERSLKIALVIAPLVCISYLIGIPYGPTGVALAYSVAMSLWLIPHVLWCIYGTPIAAGDILSAAGRPLISGAIAVLVALIVQHFVVPIPFPLVRLMFSGAAMLIVYVSALLFVMGQKHLYADLSRAEECPLILTQRMSDFAPTLEPVADKCWRASTRIALVTGASRGLGAQIARVY